MRFLSPIVIATGPLRVAPFAHPRVVHAYSRLAHSVLRTPGKAVAPTNGAACSMVVTVVVPEMAEKNSEESFACAGDPETEVVVGMCTVMCDTAAGLGKPETGRASLNRAAVPLAAARKTALATHFCYALKVAGIVPCAKWRGPLQHTARAQACEAGIRG